MRVLSTNTTSTGVSMKKSKKAKRQFPCMAFAEIIALWCRVMIVYQLFQFSSSFQLSDRNSRPSILHGCGAASCPTKSHRRAPGHVPTRTAITRGRPLSMSFLDRLQDAFLNDSSISPDKSQGQLEGPVSSYSSSSQKAAKTTGQQRWIDTHAKRTATASAPVSEEMLSGTQWMLRLYLAGVPERDPSSDLYGRRINISSRERNLSLGATFPNEPSVTVKVELCCDGICRAEATNYTTGNDGRWKIHHEQGCPTRMRLSLDTVGFRRIVQTTGSIALVFGNKSDVTFRTSSVYSIPEGYIYADTVIQFGVPGEFVMAADSQLSIEKSLGIFGVSAKWLSCGKFEGKMLRQATENLT